MPFESLALIAATATVSWLLVGAVRQYALRRGVLDVPTSRSSHTVPTARGGGAGVLVACIAGLFIAEPATTSNPRLVLAILAAVPTAIVGWLDDRASLPILPRLSAHVLSGLMLLPLAVSSEASMPAALVAAGWFFATLSAINVVNFMDGIDGIIGLQLLIFGAHLTRIATQGSPGAVLGMSLVGASAGFLLWNWSPARVFLGDVGSGSLAVLGVVAGIMAWQVGTVPFLGVFLPLFPLFLDATVAIVRRIRRGESLSQAHRTHLYQRLANQGGWRHARVSTLFGAAAAAGAVVTAVAPRALLLLAGLMYVASVVLLGLYLERSLASKVPSRTSF